MWRHFGQDHSLSHSLSVSSAEQAEAWASLNARATGIDCLYRNKLMMLLQPNKNCYKCKLTKQNMIYVHTLFS